MFYSEKNIKTTFCAGQVSGAVRLRGWFTRVSDAAVALLRLPGRRRFRLSDPHVRPLLRPASGTRPPQRVGPAGRDRGLRRVADVIGTPAVHQRQSRVAPRKPLDVLRPTAERQSSGGMKTILIPREQFPRSILFSIVVDMPDVLARMLRGCYEETAPVETPHHPARVYIEMFGCGAVWR